MLSWKKGGIENWMEYGQNIGIKMFIILMGISPMHGILIIILQLIYLVIK